MPRRVFCLGEGEEGGASGKGRSAGKLCFPSPDSSRRGMSWIALLSISVRPARTSFRVPNGYGPSGRLRSLPAENPLSGPEPRSRNKSRGLAPFSRLVPSASSADHQMTPAWFARLSRASRSRLAHWRTGCSRSLWSRSSLAHPTAPACGASCLPLKRTPPA